MVRFPILLALALSLSGCAVVGVVGTVTSAGISVASAGIGVASTAGSAAVSGASSVASGGAKAVRSVASSPDETPADKK